MLYQNRRHSAQGLDVPPYAGRLRHTGRSQFLGDGGIHAWHNFTAHGPMVSGGRAHRVGIGVSRPHFDQNMGY